MGRCHAKIAGLGDLRGTAGRSDERHDVGGSNARPVRSGESPGTSRRSAQKLGRRVAVGAAAVSLSLLTGCSAETVGQLKRLGLPEAATDRAPYIHDLWIGTWIAAGIIGVGGVGSDRLGCRPLPQQHQRHAQPEPLQPADGNLLHRRPVRGDRGAVLLHDSGPDCSAGEGDRPRGDRRRRRPEVVVDLQLQVRRDPRCRHRRVGGGNDQ